MRFTVLSLQPRTPVWPHNPLFSPIKPIDLSPIRFLWGTNYFPIVTWPRRGNKFKLTKILVGLRYILYFHSSKSVIGLRSGILGHFPFSWWPTRDAHQGGCGGVFRGEAGTPSITLTIKTTLVGGGGADSSLIPFIFCPQDAQIWPLHRFRLYYTVVQYRGTDKQKSKHSLNISSNKSRYQQRYL